MAFPMHSVRQTRQRLLMFAGAALIVLPAYGPRLNAQQTRPETLRIGTSGSLAPERGGQKNESALSTLKGFIQEETGLNNEIVRQKDWRELADGMAKGQLHLGVFQGYEFAWA